MAFEAYLRQQGLEEQPEGTAPTWGTCRKPEGFYQEEPEGHGARISLFTSGSPACWDLSLFNTGKH